MHCPACGATIQDGAKFCPKCGHQIPASAPKPGPSQGPAPSFGGAPSHMPAPAAGAPSADPAQTGRIACAVAGALTAAVSLMPLFDISSDVVAGSSFISNLYNGLGGTGSYAFQSSYSGWGLADLGNLIERYGSNSVGLFFTISMVVWVLGLVLTVAGAALVITKGRKAPLALGAIVFLGLTGFFWLLTRSVDGLDLAGGALLLALASLATLIVLIVTRGASAQRG